MKKYILRFRAVDRNNFDEIKKGLKTVETRAASARYQNIQKGDELVFVCGKERVTRKIKRVRHFGSIGGMFRVISLKKVFPSIKSIIDVRNMYYSYPDYKEKIKKFGIIALELEK